MYVCRRIKDGKFRKPSSTSGWGNTVKDNDRWTDDLQKAKLYQSKTSSAYDYRDKDAQKYEWYEARIATNAPTKEELQYWA
jgi:hypothetical protein